jgi:uncharacterized metal-binding protein YceD (DUF177 family)
MSDSDSAPLPISRPVDVERMALREDGVRLEATEEERRLVAEFLKIPAVHALLGEFDVTGNRRRAKVKGRVSGRVSQTCVVTLERFETDVVEEVEVTFAEARDEASLSPEEIERRKIDPPDEIIDGKIDLGAVMTEFLALGLDPYPRKPGVDFEPITDDKAEDSPFAALGKLKRDG